LTTNREALNEAETSNKIGVHGDLNTTASGTLSNLIQSIREVQGELQKEVP